LYLKLVYKYALFTGIPSIQVAERSEILASFTPDKRVHMRVGGLHTNAQKVTGVEL